MYEHPNMLGVMFSALMKAAAGLFFVVLCMAATGVHAERIKDLASIQGVRPNQLIGYGMVVGLDNSGDQTSQTPFTTQTITNMLGQLGVNLSTDQVAKLQLKNVAAVMVTAAMPPFARPGLAIDITVSSLGNAKSLRGGTLLMTPLKGADGQVYALAQGNVVVGGVQNASKIQVTHLSAGRIPEGAIVERGVNTQVGEGAYVYLDLQDTDFATAQRIVEAINDDAGRTVAQALDGRQIQIQAPQHPSQRVAFIGRLQNLQVTPSETIAKVVINPRTGSVVMNQNVKLDTCAVAHGTLSVAIKTEAAPTPVATAAATPTNNTPPSTPAAEGAQAAGNQTPSTAAAPPAPATPPPTLLARTAPVTGGGSLIQVKSGVNLADVVRALNALGANPLDLLAILQAMKSAGALRADLEVI